jgi:LPS-assembly protein
MIVDGRYVSDDLLLREFEIPRIGPFNSRYVTSKALVRAGLFEDYTLEASSEFNQSLITSDDFVFQRLPEFTLDGVHRFRPFGKSPYGLRLVFDNNFEATNFIRKSYFDETLRREFDSFDGWRLQAHPQVKLPFRYQNYFDAEPSFGLRLTAYELTDTDLVSSAGVPAVDPITGLVQELPGSSDRVLPDFGFRLRTTVERVFDLEDDSWFKRVAELGKTGTESSLVRLKHTITPDIRYRVVPEVDQEDNPQFDSEDKLAQRNVITYGLTQRLFGRFEERNEGPLGIAELAPEASGLRPETDTGGMSYADSDDLGLEDDGDAGGISRRGPVRELATLKLLQSFDVLENSRDRDPDRSAFSDLGLDLTLLPNEFVRLRGRSDFDVDDRNFSSYSLEAQLFDNRGDQLRTRLTFKDEIVRQLESSLEIRVTDRLKLGYYTRYDDLTGQFIENRGGIRIASSCNNCWVLDIGISDKTNPNETKFLVSATLAGLGDFGNTFLTKNRRRSANRQQ